MANRRFIVILVAAAGVSLSAALMTSFLGAQSHVWGSAILFLALLPVFWLYPREGRDRMLHRALLSYERGVIAYNRCRLADASRDLRRAASLYEQCEERAGQAFALVELGNCEKDSGHRSGALAAFQKALGLWAQIPNEDRRDRTWRLYSGYAEALAAAGDLDQAEAYAQRGIEHCLAERGEGKDLARCRIVLAGICRRRHNFVEADRLIESAREYFERANDPSRWEVLLELAKLHDDLDNFQRAGDLYKLGCQLLVKEAGRKTDTPRNDLGGIAPPTTPECGSAAHPA